jgi:nucleotidyltransferase substrate binding protein (TIGR01987 family)
MRDTRWEQRLENFEKAARLLAEAVEDRAIDTLNDLEQEGVVQRFEYTFELAWKTVKDYMEHQGLQLDEQSPRAVIKAAFAAGILSDGQGWIDMLTHRNLMSHTYDRARFEEAVQAIAGRYLANIKEALDYLRARRT